ARRPELPEEGSQRLRHRRFASSDDRACDARLEHLLIPRAALRSLPGCYQNWHVVTKTGTSLPFLARGCGGRWRPGIVESGGVDRDWFAGANRTLTHPQPSPPKWRTRCL